MVGVASFRSLARRSIAGKSLIRSRLPLCNALWRDRTLSRIQSQNFHTPSYNETDAIPGGFALAFPARDAHDTRSELAARDKQVLLAVLIWRARAAWAHDWISDPNLLPMFEALPGASFIVNGATLVKNSALASAGAELRLINGVSLLGKFDGEFANGSQTYGGRGVVRYTW